jgi:hypothetical protein
VSYTAAEKKDFDPGPCPSCGGAEIDTEWIHVPLVSQVDDSWVPGQSQCLNPECERIFAGVDRNRSGSQAHDPASRDDVRPA